MKYFPRHLLQLVLIAVCAAAAAAIAHAQDFQAERKNSRATANSARTEDFTSLDARFSIALPRQVSGFRPITFDTPQGRITAGESYAWRVDGALFEIGYLDLQKQPESAAVARAALRKFADDIASGMRAQGCKVTSRKDISLAGHVGHEMRLELPQSYIISRLYATGARIYRLAAASPKKDAPEFQTSAAGTLDSFRILSLDEVVAERERRIAASTPRPLAQDEPTARKLKSDAEDEGLRGRVKTLFVERRDLSGTWTVQTRRPSQMVYYNEGGNVTRKADYDYKGNLFQIRVYGYVDGERASQDKTIEPEYNPAAMLVSAPAASEVKTKYDPRYSFKYKYRYDERGRLTEEAWHGNSEKVWLRFVYHYPNLSERETLVYSEDGALNQKYTTTLDAHGNEIEESSHNTKTDAVDNKYVYTYEFDRHGNWIKQITSKWGTRDGKSQFLPYSITYRTITYY